MTNVKSVPLRREIVTRHQAGEPPSGMAQQLKLSAWGVRKIWRQYQNQGEVGLAIRYRQSERVIRAGGG